MAKRGALIWMLKVVTITTVGITSVSLIDNMVKQTKEEQHTVSYEPVIMYYSMDKDMSIPDGDTSFKSYMDFRAITDTSSVQYKMQQEAYTDEYGIRKYKTGDYMVAMGSYYGQVGDRFRITLDSGETIRCIMGDAKADCHTDAYNQYTPCGSGKNVIEFVVDTPALSDEARQMGDISYSDDTFEGNISKIERIAE